MILTFVPEPHEWKEISKTTEHHFIATPGRPEHFFFCKFCNNVLDENTNALIRDRYQL